MTPLPCWEMTRLAPSPTGALHLGNARTFLINWLAARRAGWRVLLRIEDLDGPRTKRGADTGLIDDLRWLGLDWDEGPVYQSSRMGAYAGAIERLIENGNVYPCICTRKEVELAASAPHLEDGATIYPGTCRNRFDSMDAARAASGREPALRFRVPAERIEFRDAFRGVIQYDLESLGDFVVAKGDGTPAYQLAVVVDDAAAGVTAVVRGDDLLDSTPRQLLIYRALGMSNQIPRYWHLPLVTGTDGRRLAKRHGDTRLGHYRSKGVTAGRMRAIILRWSGLESGESEIGIEEAIRRFDFAHIPRVAITFTPEDDAWLVGSSGRSR